MIQLTASTKKLYAVIPAAGLGSRLKSSTIQPKILTPITTTQTVWTILRQKLIGIVDHIHLIIAEENEAIIRDHLQPDLDSGFVSFSIQPQPIGMGDAIFCGYPIWSQADSILVIWGDQVLLSTDTLIKTIEHHTTLSQAITLPLTTINHPYVTYLFDDEQLIHIKQSREGDDCGESGWSDVGTFALSVDGLWSAWQLFLQQVKRGQHTHEINFLPFLPFLVNHGWQLQRITVSDAIEARGLNTPEDLIFIKQHYENQL